MSRKLIAILSALLIAATLCACNDDKEDQTTDDGKINITTEKQTVETEEETKETAEQISTPETESETEDVHYESREYTDVNDTVYILHPNGAVTLHGSKNVKDTSLVNGSKLSRTGISKDGEWSRIKYNDTIYYVYSFCLTTLENLDDGFVACDKTVKIAVKSVNVRNTPSMDNEVIGYVYDGDVVKVVAENVSKGWYKVEFTAYGGEKALGYIAINDSFFAKNDSADTAEETTAEVTEAATTAVTEEATTAAAK